MNRYIFIFFLLFILSCVSENEEPILNDEINLIVSKELSSEELIEINKTWIKDEAFRIDDFCRRHSWPVKNTQTGIRYYIYKKGNGQFPEVDDIVEIEFKVRLLDSDTTLCYSSDESGIAKFKVEKDYIETGLHEAITYLNIGSEAFVILPHYLAHGLIGNTDKIPPLSSVLYEIKLLSIR